MKRFGILCCLLFLIAFLSISTACAVNKGGILMSEAPFGTRFDISYQNWSAQDKCEMELDEGEGILVEIVRESGEMSMTIRGKNGSEPYAGQDLETGSFVVNVSQADAYVIYFTGEHASGEIVLKKISD